jgi:WD40 repeat protein
VVWNFPEGTVLEKWGKYTNVIYSLFVTPDGNSVVTGCRDGIITLQNLADSAVSKSLKAHDKTIIYSMAATPDGSRFVSGSLEGTIKLWSLPEAALIKTVRQEETVYALAISPDGKWLVSGMHGGTIKLWNMPDVSYESCLMDLACVKDTVEGLTYSVTDETGRKVTYTLPCGSPIPPGATCTCNCVPGSICTSHCTCQSNCTCQSVGKCACDQVCICVPVYG